MAQEREDERRDLLRRIATLRNDRLHDDEGSFDVFAELSPLDPLDSEWSYHRDRFDLALLLQQVVFAECRTARAAKRPSHSSIYGMPGAGIHAHRRPSRLGT